MSNTYIEPILYSKNDWEDLAILWFNAWLSTQSGVSVNTCPLSYEIPETTTEGANMVSTFMEIPNKRYNYVNANRVTVRLYKWGVKLTKNAGRVCLVRIPVKMDNITDGFVYQYILIGTKDAAVIADYGGTTSIQSKRQEVQYAVAAGTVSGVGNVTTDNISINTEDVLSRVTTLTIANNCVSHYTLDDTTKNDLLSLFAHAYGRGVNEAYTTISPSTAGHKSFGISNSHLGNYVSPIASLETVPEWLPIFYIEDGTQGIIKYLDNGDDSGKKDPFDPNNPPSKNISDYGTNFRVFITPEDITQISAKSKHKAIAYNAEYIAGGELMTDNYGMQMCERYFTSSGDPKEWQNVSVVSQVSYPNITVLHTMNSVSSAVWEVLYLFRNLYDNQCYGFSIRYQYKSGSEVGLTIKEVRNYTDFLNRPDYFSMAHRSNITDGYRYTASDGHYIDILFRSSNSGDLNEEYSIEPDDEDDTTGNDSDFSGAGGLHTFVINNTDFTTINNKLWSTDWTTVFKTSTIDPIKCIMSCKSIPFSADNVSSAAVIIANMDTGLVKNYVKNVKSFTYDMGTITAVNRNFTDITLTRIHCYLPYIGWVELPASECMSRVAYKSVEANTKRLKVKYLVDFVDGACRAVISVNGTERWFFDGHCDIDIPITSDNHTNAVHNAIVSGVSTGLSIVTGIAGAYTGNAGAIAGGVMGAVSNAPNMYPTYTYTATSNGSGYINHSMNTHIMIVVESPTVSEPKNYAHKVGKPCNQVLSLGSLNGFTKCKNVCVDGINANPDELSMIKSLLENGVYL